MSKSNQEVILERLDEIIELLKTNQMLLDSIFMLMIEKEKK